MNLVESVIGIPPKPVRWQMARYRGTEAYDSVSVPRMMLEQVSRADRDGTKKILPGTIVEKVAVLLLVI